ncbi:MAG: enoyl-CoA hydratase/isomerase family protein [Burkholderiales bacterium]|nr:enoyl-CoA hydratase/isomerase family protein [Burkholderiales bacterium]
MNDEAVLTEAIGKHVVLVTLNRPDVRNAVNADVSKGLERAVHRTEADPDCWVVILTGAGDKAFCSGADLKALSNEGPRGIRTKFGGFAGFVHQPRTKPWIAAVNGFAVAGGLEIALACDLIIAAESAKFGLPEVKRGLLAGAGGLYRLPRAIPRAIALELIMTGAVFDARQAFDWRLVNRVVAGENLISEALGLASAICANAPVAVRESLSVARRALDLNEIELKEASAAASMRNATTEDFKEGPRAFVEKRQPLWKGH